MTHSERRLYDSSAAAPVSLVRPNPNPNLNSTRLAEKEKPPTRSKTKANNVYLTSTTTATSSASTSEVQGKSQGFPQSWNPKLLVDQPEADDYLHNPQPRRRRSLSRGRGHIFTARGFANLGCLLTLGMGLLGLFVAYPVTQYYTSPHQTPIGNLGPGGINSTGQVPQLIGNFGLIDRETPQEAQSFPSYMDGSDWQLVFSDEFNTDGRTFYPGDDPYWEAVNLQYWETGDLNWYDPSAITTRNGSLEITLSKQPSHGLDYQGGMLATWNKFCFTGAIVQASVSLPGMNNVSGLWPSIWTLGNLGRVGYGATLEGMWPYSYDTCDVGAVPDQIIDGKPAAANEQGPYKNASISGLPGQRLSRCTCSGEEHPGPKHADGTYVGRSAPEIDLFEAQVDGTTGCVSQSSQWAPFNNAYQFQNDSNGLTIDDTSITIENPYTGGPLQQATSYVTQTNQICYQLNEGCFSTYGIEYKPGYEADNAYITWISDDKKAWTLEAAGVGADPITNISARPISQEPMYLIANLGMSSSFSFLDLENLVFPAIMRVDWIRVYQPPNAINIGCDPAAYPTMDYIEANSIAYNNPNLTTWQSSISGYNKTFPKNSLIDNC
ncbi:glycoside hydrolase family 16 protein [Lentinula guzmanii]|uniref:Glycoside hydrolase family 16 protein n=1 Tax=Lentinula guzmanii TaxID=2804957 RepID=A0AA38JIV0_9AGAR|nr:glycoside hydrolase family 16 protein [Lentinula guzmanii]